MLENDTFFTSIFRGFRPRFGSVFETFFKRKIYENCKSTFFAKTWKISILLRENQYFQGFEDNKNAKTMAKNLKKTKSQKTSIFSRFFSIALACLLSSKPWKYWFSLGKIDIFQVFAKNAHLQKASIFRFKNLSKTLPKRGLNPLKIDAKNVLVFNIDFLASWPRFWSLLGLQDGAKLAIFGHQTWGRGLPKAFLS